MSFAQWRNFDLTIVATFYKGTPSVVKPFSDLSQEYSLELSQIFRYHQLLSYLGTCYSFKQEHLLR